MNSTLKTILFQEKPIYYLETAEGTNLVVIRPLCEALGMDADRQIRDLKVDEMLNGEVSEQTTRLPSEDRARPYTCLPEEFIYGWIFGIKQSNTMRPETKASLTAYKRACYDILYQHFHGRIRQALALDKEQALVELELEAVEKRLQAKVQHDPDYQRKLELEAKKKQLRKVATQGRLQNRQQAFEFALSIQEVASEG